MNTPQLLSLLPSPLRFPLLQLLYRKEGKRLQAARRLNNGRFWLYRVNGTWVAAESLNWISGPELLEGQAARIPFWKYTPRPGDVVLDLGAGLGEETIVSARLTAPGGKVVAVEANPSVYAVLREVVRRNGFSNVVPLHLALGDTDGKLVLEDNGDSYLSGSRTEGGEGRTYEVEACTLTTLRQRLQLDKIDLLKCNIEGAERYLLSGGAAALEGIRHMAISCHDFRFREEGNPFFQTLGLISGALQAAGYTVERQQTGTGYIDDWLYARREGA